MLDKNANGSVETKKLIEANGAEAMSLTRDTTDPEASKPRARRSQRNSAMRIFSQHTGVGRYVALADVSLEEWNGVLSVNPTGYFIFAQAFGRAMLAKGRGAIVHVSSMEPSTPTRKWGATVSRRQEHRCFQASCRGMRTATGAQQLRASGSRSYPYDCFELQLCRGSQGSFGSRAARLDREAGRCCRSRGLFGQPTGGLCQRCPASGGWRADPKSHPVASALGPDCRLKQPLQYATDRPSTRPGYGRSA